MEENSSNELQILDSKQVLNKSTDELVDKIIEENNPDKLKDLTTLFNINIAKKNAVRIAKLNNLLDTVEDKAIERLELRPDEISNKELLDYMTVVQNQIDKSKKSVDSISEVQPVIAQQNNQVNINITEDTLSRDSKEKVIDFIQNVLKMAKKSAEVSTEQSDENK